MIAYFDTSAIIPLIIDEPSSMICTRLWNDADRSVSVRLVYPEARAALARARRLERITSRQLTAAIDELEAIVTEIDHIEVTAELAHSAGELAQTHGLRGYDAVHLAAVLAAAHTELVLATGDTDLAQAARSVGISVAFTN
ncbi:MAG: type II toxin-antitoxin system VapC family toxin [Actinomycetota bacterium]|nr:type II toxin-antitoxin system VapC family toxin [Actinomycetota bacterium]